MSSSWRSFDRSLPRFLVFLTSRLNLLDRIGVSISYAEVLEHLLGAIETFALALFQLVHGLARG